MCGNSFMKVADKSGSMWVSSDAYRLPEGRRLADLAVVVGAMVLAVLFGWVAAKGAVLPSAIAVGVLFGGIFFKRSDLAISLVLVGTLLLMGPVGLFFPALTKLARLFSLLGFFLLASMTLIGLSARQGQVPLPAFMVLLLSLMCVSTVTSFFGGGGVAEVSAGVKRAWQLWGLMLALAMMPLNDRGEALYQGWLKLLFFIALLQLPFALYQYWVLVPQRMGMGHGVVPIDVVAGTFEASMTGGGSSGTMAMFLILVLAFVLASWKEGLLKSQHALLLSCWLGVPLFIGETKLVLVLLPLMLLIVFVTDIRKHPVAALLAVLLGILLTTTLAWLYFKMLATDFMTPAERLQQTLDYNFGAVGYSGRYSLNRTSVVTFWMNEHGWRNPVTMLFGHGLGSSYSGDGSLVPGHLNRFYAGLDINLTTLSTLLWDGGLLAVCLLIGAFFFAWRTSSRLLSQAGIGWDKVILNVLRVSLIFNFFMVFYSNSMLSSMSHEALLAFTFGYLAWLARRSHVATPAIPDTREVSQFSA